MQHYVKNWTRVSPQISAYNQLAGVMNERGISINDLANPPSHLGDYDPADVSGSHSPQDYVPPNEGFDSTPPPAQGAPQVPVATAPAVIPSIVTPVESETMPNIAYPRDPNQVRITNLGPDTGFSSSGGAPNLSQPAMRNPNLTSVVAGYEPMGGTQVYGSGNPQGALLSAILQSRNQL